MVFGTFDILHPGHRNFFKQALFEGEELIIVVARDKTVLRFKEHLRHSEEERLKAIEKAFPDASVLLGDLEDPLALIRKYHPEKVCLGYDQVGFSQDLIRELPEVKIKRLKPYYPEKYKSSKMMRP